jgi:hypothetical protein
LSERNNVRDRRKAAVIETCEPTYLLEELVNCVDRVRLNSIVGGEDYKHRRLFLKRGEEREKRKGLFGWPFSPEAHLDTALGAE